MGATQHGTQKSHPLCQELCEPPGPPEGLLPLPGLPQLLLFPP